MSEYIKREDVLCRFTFEHGDRIPEVDIDNFSNSVSIKDIKCVIRAVPAADVAPVRHGKWIKQENYPGTYSKCSECDQRVGGYTPNYKYCPNCGARMDQEEEA